MRFTGFACCSGGYRSLSRPVTGSPGTMGSLMAWLRCHFAGVQNGRTADHPNTLGVVSAILTGLFRSGSTYISFHQIARGRFYANIWSGFELSAPGHCANHCLSPATVSPDGLFVESIRHVQRHGLQGLG